MNTNQFTQKTMEALQAAQRLAIEYSNQALEQEHMLVALTQQQDGLIPQLLTKMNVDPGTFETAAAEKVSQLPHVTGSGRDPDKVYISNELDQALTAAEKQAQQMKDEYISVEHVFMGMLQRPGRVAGELFKQFGITPEKFMQVLSAVRGNQRVTTDNPESTYDALKKYGQDLVEAARANKLDPVIGRDSEIRNVIRILSRKRKNNPVLIGEAGVGKTAIAEGLAQRIVRGDVPENLKDRIVFSLDMGALVAGAKYRGEFEAILRETGVDFTEGKVWTTDAFYRETRAKFEKRKAQGCVCVDMECSALMALAQFRGIDVFEFFYAGDNLDREQWDPRSLSTHAKLDEKDRAAYLALELARKITL